MNKEKELNLPPGAYPLEFGRKQKKDFTKITLGELLSSKIEIIRRNAAKERRIAES